MFIIGDENGAHILFFLFLQRQTANPFCVKALSKSGVYVGGSFTALFYSFNCIGFVQGFLVGCFRL